MSFIYIFLIPEDPIALKVSFKLIPMVLIIGYALLQLPERRAAEHYLILAGLLCSMIGDAFIAFSFVAGLGAFLVGHLFYLSGFIKMRKSSNPRLAVILLLAIYSFLIGRELIGSLQESGEGALMVPVLLYILVISLMALTAFMTGSKWAIAGSLLFVLSDTILSWNMFVSPVPFSGVFIMTTYYTAQFLIATSVRADSAES